MCVHGSLKSVSGLLTNLAKTLLEAWAPGPELRRAHAGAYSSWAMEHFSQQKSTSTPFLLIYKRKKFLVVSRKQGKMWKHELESEKKGCNNNLEAWLSVFCSGFYTTLVSEQLFILPIALFRRRLAPCWGPEAETWESRIQFFTLLQTSCATLGKPMVWRSVDERGNCSLEMLIKC